MEAVLVLLTFALLIALIVGLVKPSIVLRWTKKPTRLKVLGYWFLSIVILGIGSVILSDDIDQAKTKMETAKNYIKKEKYNEAISTLKNIKKTDTAYYANAQLLIEKSDSLNNVSEEQKRIAKTKKLKEAAEKEKKSQTEQIKQEIKREIKSIEEGVDFASYKDEVSSMQMEIVLFGTWAKIIRDGKKSDITEIKKLTKELESKVVQIQRSEFPKLRKAYGKVVANKMWENDVYVSVIGRGHRYINFSGGIFAANKNKKDFQNQVSEVLHMFRFKQARYRWYKGKSEYTYYNIEPKKDNELVNFK